MRYLLFTEITHRFLNKLNHAQALPGFTLTKIVIKVARKTTLFQSTVISAKSFRTHFFPLTFTPAK